ncbi:MAG TPA: 23S rRNA (pseudouridine(1915)-N(3))-methyltransferase RlmH [Candidatus Saccharimonadales bacterium]|nr:23S rRNA (pseudouridine(1915)-N(3))-methyltransferase RlmH [Candidatus Saccharimonadales bacterium]
MKLHIITVGEPKLAYAQNGWQEYVKRMQRFHQLRLTHIANKKAYDAESFTQAMGSAYKVALDIEGTNFSSPELAAFLEKQAQGGREVCFVIGGPEGLPQTVRQACDAHWSLSRLTLPHDLAMLVTAEALYRASTINAGHPYHK